MLSAIFNAYFVSQYSPFINKFSPPFATGFVCVYSFSGSLKRVLPSMLTRL